MRRLLDTTDGAFEDNRETQNTALVNQVTDLQESVTCRPVNYNKHGLDEKIIMMD